MIATVHEYLQRTVATARRPDSLIGGQEDPYLLRWYLTPWSRYDRDNPPFWSQFTKRLLFNIYLHKFIRSDYEEACHDHPWVFNISILLDGDYWEHTLVGKFFRQAGMTKFRWGKAPHRVELLGPMRGEMGIPFEPKDDNPDGSDANLLNSKYPVWTIFITGPVVRNWGFYCPKGWIPWKQFMPKYGKERAGCGD